MALSLGIHLDDNFDHPSTSKKISTLTKPPEYYWDFGVHPIDDPDIAKSHVLAVLLQLEAFGGWPNFFSAIGVFDGHIVMDLQTVPPDRRPLGEHDRAGTIGSTAPESDAETGDSTTESSE